MRFGKRSFSVNSFIFFLLARVAFFVFTIATIFAHDSRQQYCFMHKYNSMLNTISSIANQTAGLPLAMWFFIIFPWLIFSEIFRFWRALIIPRGSFRLSFFFFFVHQTGYTYNKNYHLIYLANWKLQFLVSGSYKQLSNEKQTHFKDIIWLSINKIGNCLHLWDIENWEVK